MKLLIIILCTLGAVAAALVLLVLLFILFGSVRLYAAYHEEGGFSASVGVLGFKIALYPRKKRKNSNKAPEKPEKKEKNTSKKKSTLIPESTADKIRLLLELLPAISLKFRLYRFEFLLVYDGGDAASTAIAVGRIYAAFGAFFGAAQNAIYVDRPVITVTPEYLGGGTRLNAEACLGLNVLSAAATLLRMWRIAKKFAKKESVEK